MKSISGQRLGKILESKGWTLKSVKGSHHVYVKAGRKERISVPVHGSSDLKKGLLVSLMKIAEIDEKEL
jgi:predicted RNA binding protein YcfA (HicA-like mRNA interferase family)